VQKVAQVALNGCFFVLVEALHYGDKIHSLGASIKKWMIPKTRQNDDPPHGSLDVPKCADVDQNEPPGMSKPDR
jgi:hypothetical protein